MESCRRDSLRGAGCLHEGGRFQQQLSLGDGLCCWRALLSFIRMRCVCGTGEERGARVMAAGPRGTQSTKLRANQFLFWAHIAGLNHECTAFVSGSNCWANCRATPVAALGVIMTAGRGLSSFLRATSRDTPNDAPRAGTASNNFSSDEDPVSAPDGPV